MRVVVLCEDLLVMSSVGMTNASAKQTSVRTAVSNARSETCQKQPVPRKQLLLLGDCLHRKGLPSLRPQRRKSPRKTVYCAEASSYYLDYCHEIASSTNAATSQSSLEAHLAKRLKCASCLRTVGIECCSFSSLPVRTKLPTATKASTCSKQEAPRIDPFCTKSRSLLYSLTL
jgi:hypothetical protein